MTTLMHRTGAPPVPRPGEPAGVTQPDLVEVLTADHLRLVAELSRVREMNAVDPRNPQLRHLLCCRLLAALSQHLVATSCCVHPAARALGPDSGELLREARANGSRMHQLMRCTEQMLGGDMLAARYSFTDLLAALDAALAEHIRLEESRLLPAVRAAVGEERLLHLGHKVARRLPHGPTRAHPRLSFRSPWAPASARVAAAWDHVQDVLDSRVPAPARTPLTPAPRVELGTAER